MDDFCNFAHSHLYNNFDEYKEGLKAYEDGLLEFDNPYLDKPQFEKESFLWLTGWKDCESFWEN